MNYYPLVFLIILFFFNGLASGQSKSKQKILVSPNEFVDPMLIYEPQNNKTFTLKQLGFYSADLNNYSLSESIEINTLEEFSDDPGDFYNIAIGTEGKFYELTNYAGWVKYNSTFAKHCIDSNNCIVHLNIGVGSDVLILQGYHYSSEKYPLLTILTINENSEPQIIFNKKAKMLDIISSSNYFNELLIEMDYQFYKLNRPNGELALDPIKFSGEQDATNNISTNFQFQYLLKSEEGVILGALFARPRADKWNVFSEIYVLDISQKNPVIEYSIDGPVLRNKKGIDLKVNEVGFYGYKFITKKNDCFVLNVLSNNGNNVSGNVSIVWDNTENIFETLKTP